MAYRCKACGNTEEFYANDDTSNVDVTACAKCGSDKIERVD